MVLKSRISRIGFDDTLSDTVAYINVKCAAIIQFEP